MDKNGLLNPDGLWNSRGAALAGAMAGAAVAGWNYISLEQSLAALALFSALFLPLLSAAFALAIIGQAGGNGVAWAGGLVLEGYKRLILAQPAGAVRQQPVPVSTAKPLARCRQPANGGDSNLSPHRRAA